GIGGTQSFSIPAHGRVVKTTPGPMRVQSTEALVALERSSSSNKAVMNVAASITAAQSTLVFPHAAVGGGYASTLILVNTSTVAQTFTVGFATSTTTVRIDANSAARVPVPAAPRLTEAVKVTTNSPFAASGVILGILDIETQTAITTLEARPAANDFTFPYVLNDNGLFTGLALVAGTSGAR